MVSMDHRARTRENMPAPSGPKTADVGSHMEVSGKLPTTRMTQTQIGTIGEVTVAAQLMLASDGRLSPFLPFADDDGIDLIVYDKVTGASLPVQVKARTSAKLGKSDTVVFDVRRKTFSDHAGSFLLGILLDMTGGHILRAWLIPMSELGSVARVGSEKLSITPSAKEGSKDRYAPYRCRDMAGVADRLAIYLDRRPAA
jgi:hypothetical protein